jgi:hypothetical protein
VPDAIWNSYFKFCVERNPWDKTLSFFHMLNASAGGAISFDDFIESNQFPIDFEAYADRHGELMVDAVIKYENLEEGLHEVFASLGLKFDGDLGVRAKADYRPDTRPYSEVFNQQQKDIVAECFAREIAMHDYEF